MHYQNCCQQSGNQGHCQPRWKPHHAHGAQESLKRRHEELQNKLPPASRLQSTLHAPSTTIPATHRAGIPGHTSRLQTSAGMRGWHVPAGVDSRLAARAWSACRNNIHRFQSRFWESQSSLSDIGAKKLWMPRKVRSACCAYETVNVILRLQLRGGTRVDICQSRDAFFKEVSSVLYASSEHWTNHSPKCPAALQSQVRNRRRSGW